MTSIKQTTSVLEDSLKKLLYNYQFLKDENELLYHKVATLSNEIVKEKQRFNELKETYNLLKVAKTINGSIEDSKETKLKINALIREIDACVEQLSK